MQKRHPVKYYSAGDGGFDVIDTQNIEETADVMKAAVEEYRAALTALNSKIDSLLGSWDGASADAFEQSYLISKISLKDSGESLEELAKRLYKANAGYGKADGVLDGLEKVSDIIAGLPSFDYHTGNNHIPNPATNLAGVLKNMADNIVNALK